jgi:transposase InsO family protein
MPWKTTTPMEEAIRFAVLAQSGRFTVRELCEQFGISRKTGYKHLERYAEGGAKALAPRSSRPHRSPARTDEEVIGLVLAERRQHRTWGPKKLRAVLETKHGIATPPACSTIAELLRRHGLSVRRRRRPGAYEADAHGCTQATQPNHVWTVDFKGWFLLGDGQRCDPLTVCDHYSHYILCADALPNQQYKGTLHVFRGLMRHHGLPEVIHCDLGSPFASYGLGRLSALSAWWVEQGIEVEFSRPGSPQDNASHERMHRDLKAEAIKPASTNLPAQKRRLERWRHEFNHERPHESLGQRTPASFYQASSRRLNEDDRPLVYPSGWLVKVVSASGHLAHDGHHYPIGEVFAGKRVALYQNPEGGTELHFANLHLGNLAFDSEGGRFRPSAYIARPPIPSTCSPTTNLDYQIYLDKVSPMSPDSL